MAFASGTVHDGLVGERPDAVAALRERVAALEPRKRQNRRAKRWEHVHSPEAAAFAELAQHPSIAAAAKALLGAFGLPFRYVDVEGLGGPAAVLAGLAHGAGGVGETLASAARQASDAVRPAAKPEKEEVAP